MNYFSFINIIIVKGYIKFRIEMSSNLLTGAIFCYTIFEFLFITERRHSKQICYTSSSIYEYIN